MFGLVLMMSAVGTGDRDGRRAAPAAPGARGVDPRRRAGRARACRWCSRRASYGRAALDRRGGGDRGGVGVRSARVRQPACNATAPTRPAGRAFARFETRFQLVWVLGGVLAVIFPGGGRCGHLPGRARCCCSRACRTSARSAARRPAADDVPPSPRKSDRRRPSRPSRTGGCRIEVRPIADDELPTMLEVDRRGFGAPPRTPERADSWVRAELDRTRCAFEARHDGRLHPRLLVRADDARRRAACPSRPCRRSRCSRRTAGAGVLTAMMGALHDDARARGEIGVGAHRVGEHHLRALRLRRRHVAARLLDRPRTRAAWRGPVDDPGRVRLVARGEADVDLPRGLRAACGVGRAGHGLAARLLVARGVLGAPRPGARSSRPCTRTPHGRRRRLRLLRDQGRVVRRLRRPPDVRVGPPGDESDRARRALGVRVRRRPRASRSSRRTCRPTSRCGSCSPIRASCAPTSSTTRCGCCRSTSAALLAARTYSTAGTLVIEVVDPDGSRSQFALDGGPDGASCRERVERDARPLVSRASTLGALVARRQLVGDARGGRRGRRAHRRARSRGPTRCSRPLPRPATLTWF